MRRMPVAGAVLLCGAVLASCLRPGPMLIKTGFEDLLPIPPGAEIYITPISPALMIVYANIGAYKDVECRYVKHFDTPIFLDSRGNKQYKESGFNREIFPIIERLPNGMMRTAYHFYESPPGRYSVAYLRESDLARDWRDTDYAKQHGNYPLGGGISSVAVFELCPAPRELGTWDRLLPNF